MARLDDDGSYPRAVHILKTQRALKAWMDVARPGERAAYHFGHLASERERFARENGRELHYLYPCNRMGQIAYDGYLRGEFELCQRRCPDGGCAYLIEKRKWTRR